MLEQVLKQLTRAKRGGQITREEASKRLLDTMRNATEKVAAPAPIEGDRPNTPIQIRTSRLRRLLVARNTKITIPLHELMAKERRARGRQTPRPS